MSMTCQAFARRTYRRGTPPTHMPRPAPSCVCFELLASPGDATGVGGPAVLSLRLAGKSLGGDVTGVASYMTIWRGDCSVVFLFNGLRVNTLVKVGPGGAVGATGVLVRSQ